MGVVRYPFDVFVVLFFLRSGYPPLLFCFFSQGDQSDFTFFSFEAVCCFGLGCVTPLLSHSSFPPRCFFFFPSEYPLLDSLGKLLFREKADPTISDSTLSSLPASCLSHSHPFFFFSPFDCKVPNGLIDTEAVARPFPPRKPPILYASLIEPLLNLILLCFALFLALGETQPARNHALQEDFPL